MSTDSLPRDFYDLNYKRKTRRRQRIVPEGEMSDAPEEFEVTTVPLEPRNIRLNTLSKAIQNPLQKKDAFTICFNFLNCAIETPMHEPVYAATPFAAAKALPSRPDSDQEAQLLIHRLEWSQPDPAADKVLGHSLQLLGDVVRLKQRNCDDTPRYPDIFYRLQSSESQTFYADEVGLHCARWLQERNFGRPSAQDFTDHCNEKKPFHSPYISMTESPWRLLQLDQHTSGLSEYVFIIDAKRLLATKIQVERTTKLAQQWGIRYTGGQDRVHFVTETHWVAEGWIPHDCITKTVSLNQFRKICLTKGIATGYDRFRMVGLRLELRDFDEGASRARRRKVKVAPSRALEEDQDDIVRRTEDLSIQCT